MDHFDVIVIGTGVAGQTAAQELAVAGKRVAVVDRREYGGTCMLRGCEAKKVLFTAAEAVERMTAQRGNGPAGDVGLEWPALVAFKRQFTDPVTEHIEGWFADAGVVLLHGEARFVGHDRLSVAGVTYTAEHIVVATGAQPVPLGMDGAELVSTSEDFMAAEELGARIVFVGGGYISLELAHIAHAAGSRVMVCHRGSQVLKGFDAELAAMLVDGYRQAGIEVRTHASVRAVEHHGESLAVVLESGEKLACDMVVHGAGRVPQIEELDLNAAGVSYGRGGVEVDEHMRSVSNSLVWAAGDAAARGLPLTPAGILQARVIVGNILGRGAPAYDPSVTPSVVFSEPPLAAVGLTESHARERGLDVRGDLIDTTSWVASRRAGARVSGAKVLIDKASDLIVGAHLLGYHADEVINVFALAIVGGTTAAELRSVAWAYPTAGSDIVYLL